MAFQTIPLASSDGGLFRATLTYDDATLDISSVSWINNTTRAITISITQGNKNDTATLQPGTSGTVPVKANSYKLRTTADPRELEADYTISVT